MTYKPYYTWVRSTDGSMHKGRTANGIVVAIKGQEITGKLAEEISYLENQIVARIEPMKAEGSDDGVSTKAEAPVKPKKVTDAKRK